MQPVSGSLVGALPVIVSQPLIGSQPMPMLVPVPAPVLLPPILPALLGSAAEPDLLDNVKLAEQCLREVNITFDEQRREQLTDEDDAVNKHRPVPGDVPMQPVGVAPQDALLS